MALGLEQAGFNTKMAVENNKWAVKTLKKNRPHWNVIEEDIAYDNMLVHDMSFCSCDNFRFADNLRNYLDRDLSMHQLRPFGFRDVSVGELIRIVYDLYSS